MKELKTLKDFEDEHCYGFPEMRDEAIKDIRELKRASLSTGSKVMQEILGTYAEEPVIEYIKWKFNITEEDLKGG